MRRPLLRSTLITCCAALYAAAARGAPAPAESPGALGASVPAAGDQPADGGQPFLPPGSGARASDGVSLRVGGSRARFVGPGLGVPPLLLLAIEWNHVAARIRAIYLEVGLRGSGLRAPYDRVDGGAATSYLWGALGTARVVYAGRGWEAGAGIGVGVAAWSGLGPANPFTEGNRAAGTAVMPSVAAGAELAFRVGGAWWLGLAPRYGSSATVGATFAGGVRRVDHLDLELGLGRRF